MDREQLVLAVSTEAGFTKNLTLIRAIQRDDVEPKDTQSYLNISLTAPVAVPVVHVKSVTDEPSNVETENTEPENNNGTTPDNSGNGEQNDGE